VVVGSAEEEDSQVVLDADSIPVRSKVALEAGPDSLADPVAEVCIDEKDEADEVSTVTATLEALAVAVGSVSLLPSWVCETESELFSETAAVLETAVGAEMSVFEDSDMVTDWDEARVDAELGISEAAPVAEAVNVSVVAVSIESDVKTTGVEAVVGSEAEPSEIQLEMVSDAVDEVEEVGAVSERVEVG
jgi:hypothetical protein